MITVLSCNHRKTVVPAYYFWRTGSDIDTQEKNLLRRLQIHTLYTKILDVDWGGFAGAVPVASKDIHEFNRQLNVYDSLNIQLVPVVFITNKTFSEIDSAEIPLLVKRVLRRCLPSYDDTGIAPGIRSDYRKRTMARTHEIQFDCDWSAKTAGKYFYFLKWVRQLLPSDSIRLSATIRLHQYKYPEKTGVPPVERGMLMLYNVSDLTQYSRVNSIFEQKKAAAYFEDSKRYPLPLDIALPAYSWGLVFRNGQFYQIENGMDVDAISGSTVFEPENSTRINAGPATVNPDANGVRFYRVKKDTVMGELFLRPGDEIKIESIDSLQLIEAAKLSRKAVNSDTVHIAFFELSSNEIKRFSDETLALIYSSYH